MQANNFDTERFGQTQRRIVTKRCDEVIGANDFPDVNVVDL